MKKHSNLKMVLAFTALTVVLTAVVIVAWEQLLLPPFYAWTETRYPGPGNEGWRWTLQQRVEHFFISMTVDLVVVSILLWLVGREQRKLVESEARYRSLFEHATDGIGVVSAQDFRLVDANNKFCEILGCQAQGLKGRDVRELIRAERDGDTVDALLREADSDVERELNVLSADYRPLPVSLSVSSIANDGVKLIIVLVRDLSARRRLEAEKEQMQQQLFQTSKLASVGELSAGVAHEINNPLNGIINFAQLLKDEEVERPEFDRQMIDGIIEEGSRIAQIVRGLLTFARHDNHDLSSVRLADVVQTSVSLFGRQLEKDGVTVEIDVPRDLPLVHADASRLRQVVVNMISNAHHALRAKESGERVFRIAGRAIERPGGDSLRLEFYDNGRGIRREDLPKVFDPFFTTRRDGGGTGLGLSISFGIVRDHGGTISVESEAGEFTRFVVELPAMARARQEALYV
ncbi:MAG TPA: ATP-binding protein [Pyrinomonadaceae bacterium]|nr:ATP-binding protein [Pyrinomonadaceae bacterium]